MLEVFILESDPRVKQIIHAEISHVCGVGAFTSSVVWKSLPVCEADLSIDVVILKITENEVRAHVPEKWEAWDSL